MVWMGGKYCLLGIDGLCFSGLFVVTWVGMVVIGCDGYLCYVWKIFDMLYVMQDVVCSYLDLCLIGVLSFLFVFMFDDFDIYYVNDVLWVNGWWMNGL